MKEIDLTGKCGSCFYFHDIEGKASGDCHRFPYGDDVVHDPEHPFYQPTRSRLKCKEYRTKPITHYDLLISKTPEEMAKFLTILSDPEWHIDGNIFDMTVPKESSWLSWLKSPVEVDNGT